jgi:prepilin-type N-terminal cleavage/methylation domain-containing protein
MTASTKAFRDAFSLIELLVSIAVVAVLLGTVIALLNTATSVTTQSKKHLDTDDEARMVFDRMAEDFNRLVNRTDVDYLFAKNQGAGPTVGANDAFFFYSEAPALATSTTLALQNSVALIGYRIDTSYNLDRLGKGLVLGSPPPDGMAFLTYFPVTTVPPPQPGTAAFVPPNSLSTFANPAWQPYVGTVSDTPPYSNGSSADFHVLSADVFRLEFCFLLKPYKVTDGVTVKPSIYSNYPYDIRAGHVNLSTSGYNMSYGVGLNDVQAVVVTIALLDANSRKIISISDLGKLAAALTDSDVPSGNLAASPPILMAQTWNGEISPSTFSGTLKAVAPAVRIYQRTFYLSTFLN